ncbi:hypothetical protein PM082_017767 [Marasmius tenuissimus]|nr:hypothetical protein PM082_017767 [Marasmius tenuissimus]
MFRTAFLAILAFSLCVLFVDFPPLVTMISPNSSQLSSGIGNGSWLPIVAWGPTMSKTYEGLRRVVSWTMAAPNGTIVTESTLGTFNACIQEAESSGAVSYAPVDQEENYEARWYLFYAIANSRNLCTKEEPLSLTFRNFTLESHFRVRLNGSLVNGSESQARSMGDTMNWPLNEHSFNWGSPSLGSAKPLIRFLISGVLIGTGILM